MVKRKDSSLCGAAYWYGHTCEKRPGHEGSHEAVIRWHGDTSARCSAESQGFRCDLRVVHSGSHKSEPSPGFTYSWSD